MQFGSQRLISGFDQSILSLVNQYRHEARKENLTQQFSHKDYIKLKSSIIGIRKKYQSATYFQVQNKEQEGQRIQKESSRFGGSQMTQNQFCKGILEKYIDDIKKRKKIQILLNMQQNWQKYTPNKQKNLQALKKTVWSKCRRDQNFVQNYFDHKFNKNNTISKEQRRRNLPIEVMKESKEKYYRPPNTLKDPISSRKNKIKTEINQGQFSANQVKYPSMQENLTSDYKQHVSINGRNLIFVNSTFHLCKKSRKIKAHNKEYQQLQIKKAKVQKSERQNQHKKIQRQNNRNAIIHTQKVRQRREPKKREQLFKIYSFLNKSNQKLSLNRLKGLKQISNNIRRIQKKDSFQGWSRMNSIRQDMDTMFP